MLGAYQLRPRPYGLRSSPRQFLQLVASHVPSSSGHVERGFSELRSLRNEGRVYMVSEASATSRASRHSRPESFNDIARQHIGRPERILRELQFPAPAFWPMADSGGTVNVMWETELTANFRARSHALQGFQGMASFAIGEAFLDVLVSDSFTHDPRQPRARGASWGTDKWDLCGRTARYFHPSFQG